MCVCVCVCVCERACTRARARARLCVCVCVCVCVSVNPQMKVCSSVKYRRRRTQVIKVVDAMVEGARVEHIENSDKYEWINNPHHSLVWHDAKGGDLTKSDDYSLLWSLEQRRTPRGSKRNWWRKCEFTEIPTNGLENDARSFPFFFKREYRGDQTEKERTKEQRHIGKRRSTKSYPTATTTIFCGITYLLEGDLVSIRRHG